MNMNIDLSWIASMVLGSIGIILLIATYAYIEKLENIGCPCSEHPYRRYIKGYCIFAIVYIFATMFIPPSTIIDTLGTNGTMVFFAVKSIFTLATLIFFVLSFIYARFLINDKCKCSEDIRREALYIWALLNIIILGALIVIPFMEYNVSIGIALASSAVDDMYKKSDTVKDITVNPLKTIGQVLGTVKKTAQKVAKSKRR